MKFRRITRMPRAKPWRDGPLPARRAARGFTLIELLVVMAIIGLLGALVLAGARRAMDAAHRTVCLNNLRQFQVAWQLFAAAEGRLPAHYDDGALRAKYGSWVVGDAREDSDDYNLRRGTLFPYVETTAIYKCPADRNLMTNSAGIFPKNRTYSISMKLTEGNITLPSEIERPSSVFVFAEEAEVDQGVLGIYYPPKRRWNHNDYPAHNHPGKYAMSFADGHVEAIPWVNPACAIPFGLGGPDLENIQRMLPKRP
jgi:prepilin-type N-terminal cleavage/methylation domain-containing protein/prepilin-type processing-associated H-X9-DG protein